MKAETITVEVWHKCARRRRRVHAETCPLPEACTVHKAAKTMLFKAWLKLASQEKPHDRRHD